MAVKDNLKDLLQERFGAHEMGVDPGLWQAISGQLAATAPAADGLSELLKDRFQQHEAQVDPGTWGQISSQLGHGAAAGTVGGSGLGGWMAAGIAATLLTGGLLFWAARPDAPVPVTTTAQIPVTTPTQAQANAPQATTSTNAGPSNNASTTLVPNAVAERPEPQRSDAQVVGDQGKPASNAGKPAGQDQPVDKAAEEKPGAHMPEVTMIMQRLIEQTRTEPVIAETESVPEVGLVHGQEPLLPEFQDPPMDEVVVPTPAPAPLVWIPNTFSSNGDGTNDVFEVKAEGLTNLEVRIYSLTNQLVFRANDLRAWDGRDMSGQQCAEGYYFYAIEGVDGNGKPYSKGQTVRLFR